MFVIVDDVICTMCKSEFKFACLTILSIQLTRREGCSVVIV